MPKRTRAYHDFLLEQLADPVFAAEYLNEARKDSRPVFLKALRNLAEARRMSVVAAETGLNRESLYRSLSEEGNPRLETYDSVLSVLGIDYEFKPREAAAIPTPIPTQSAPREIQAANQITVVTSQKSSAWTNTLMNYAAQEPVDEEMAAIRTVQPGMLLAEQMRLEQEAGQI